MPKIVYKSVYDAFNYAMEHYYPFGMKQFAEKKDSYAVISIQDTHTQGFGVRFAKSEKCIDALTLYFDDVDKPLLGAVHFTDSMAREIIAFIEKNKNVDTLLVHCFGGESRSRAVAAFANYMLYGDDKAYFINGSPNMLVYNTLVEAYKNPAKGDNSKTDGLNVLVLSRDKAEEMKENGFPQNAAVISFYDTVPYFKDYAPVDYSKVCDRVFTVKADDIVYEELDELDLTEDTYLPNALSLAWFIKSAVKDNCTIICQCEYGQGRSAACAAAILEYYKHDGISVFANYDYAPNQIIYNKLLATLRECE